MIHFRIRDPLLKSYHKAMDIDEALRTRLAFLSNDVVYELRSELKDRKGNYIYHGDIVQNGEGERKLVLYGWMSRFDFEYTDNDLYLGFGFVGGNKTQDDLMKSSIGNNDRDIIGNHNLNLEILSEK